MKTRTLVTFGMVAILALLAGCNIIPVPSGESAKVISKATFENNTIANRSRSLSSDILGKGLSSSGKSTNPDGGTATVVVNSDGSVGITYDKWYVKSDDKEYTVSGSLTLKWTNAVSFTTDLGTGSISYTFGYSLKGDLTVANGIRSTSSPIDLVCSYKYGLSDNGTSLTYTVTGTTTGTIGSDSVNSSYSFSTTISSSVASS